MRKDPRENSPALLLRPVDLDDYLPCLKAHITLEPRVGSQPADCGERWQGSDPRIDTHPHRPPQKYTHTS